MALRVDEQGLGARQLALDGAAGLIGDERGQRLDGHVLLAAEAAADEGILNFDLLGRQAEGHRDLVQRGVGALVRRVEADAVSVRHGHGAFRLKEGVLRERGGEVILHDKFRVGNGLLGIAAGDVLVRQQVALAVDERRIGRGRLLWVVHGGQNLIFDLDELLGLFQNLRRLGCDKGQRVAEEVDDTADGDHDVPVVDDVADDVLARHIRCGQHADNAGQRGRLGRVDGQHAGARIFAAHGGAVAHFFGVVIVGVFAGAEDLLLDVQTLDTGADLPVRRGGQGDLLFAQDLPGQTDGLDDLDIAGAAAVVVADGPADLLLRRVRRAVEQGLGAQHHTGDAEAALHGASLAEGEGVGSLFKVGKTLDRQDVLAVEPLGIRNAGAAGLPVDEHGACAAGALAAAVFYGGEMQLIAQVAQQLLLFGDGNFGTVYVKCCHGNRSPL